MTMIHATTAIRQLSVDGDPRTFAHGNSRSNSQSCSWGCTSPFHKSSQNPCIQLKFPNKTLNSHHLCGSSKEGSPRNLLRRWPINASSDQDYRSSRNIAISVFKRYRNVVDRGGGENLRDFITAGVNAYALGCTDGGLRKELMHMKASGLEIEGLQNFGGGTSVTFKILTEEVEECILWLSIIFITILCTPQPTVIRWSSTPPVSDETMDQWKGFCAIIADAYYKRGMAWLPVKTLQLEQMAVTGRAEEPSLVASRMRLVFSTLEVVSPQWPKV